MSKNIIALGGRPGTGKTTILKKFMKKYTWESVEPEKLLRCHYSKEIDTYILGIYSEDLFSGTDKLSMAVQPAAKKFISETTSSVLFEGDRLFNSSFLEFIKEEVNYDNLYIYILDIQKDLFYKRYEERGSDQNPEFLKSRETKIRNIEGNYTIAENLEFLENNELSDLENNVKLIDMKIRGEL